MMFTKKKHHDVVIALDKLQLDHSDFHEIQLIVRIHGRMAIVFVLEMVQMPFLKINFLECKIIVYGWTYFLFCLPLKEFVFRFTTNQL